jgi:predicted phosphate transport protein (TIGR00153 family)
MGPFPQGGASPTASEPTMIFGDSKTKQVHALIVEYCDLIGHAVSEYKHLIDDYLDWDKHFKEVSKDVRKTESKADDLLKQIERSMLGGAMLPAYREDYIGLLEALDKVANKCEDVAQTVRLIRPDIPEAIRPALAEVAALTCEQWKPVPGLVQKLLDGEKGIVDGCDALDELEGRIDKIQRTSTRVIFRDHDELRLSHKMLVKQLLDEVCHVSDRIEDVGDHLSLIAIKHSL